MKVGIIVYSQTGHTYSVASKLYEKIKKDGHDVKLEKIEAERDMKKKPEVFEITNSPKVDGYDVIIFASYVEAFMLCPVMRRYLETIPLLKNKEVLCLVTQHFPYAWLGGNSAIRKMKSLCQSKEATIQTTGVINWTNKKRESMIESVINDFSKALNRK